MPKTCAGDCAYYLNNGMFELCSNGLSVYKDQFARYQLHTIQHMSTVGGCGKQMPLFKQRKDEDTE